MIENKRSSPETAIVGILAWFFTHITGTEVQNWDLVMNPLLCLHLDVLKYTVQ